MGFIYVATKFNLDVLVLYIQVSKIHVLYNTCDRRRCLKMGPGGRPNQLNDLSSGETGHES